MLLGRVWIYVYGYVNISVVPYGSGFFASLKTAARPLIGGSFGGTFGCKSTQNNRVSIKDPPNKGRERSEAVG